MSQRYSVVFSGKVAPGCSEDEVQAKLAESFGMPAEKVARIFTGQPVVIKKGLDKVTAERFQQKFSAAGAVSEIRQEVQTEASPAPPSPATQEPVARPPQAPPAPAAVPSGFWRRFLAFLIDILILAVPGWVIGWVFFDQLVRIGQSGKLIGFVIALGYFAILDSSLGNGQTFGKRLMKIRVVDLQGAAIPLQRSALRYFIVALPYFCNGLMLSSQSIWLAILLVLIIFGLGGSIIYLFIFNRNNRRSVHDFVAGTLVVKAEPLARPKFLPVWRGHYVILAIILVSLGVAGVVFVPSFLHKEPITQMLTMQKSLQQEANIHTVGLQTGYTRMGNRTTHWFAVNVVVSDPHLDLEETANHFATLILIRGSQLAQKDLLVVNVLRGYDIGISSWWETQRFSYTPTQWRAKLGLQKL